jgi:hexosaminidase
VEHVKQNLNLLPFPQELQMQHGMFDLVKNPLIVYCEEKSGEDRFSAEYLVECLQKKYGVTISPSFAANSKEANLIISRDTSLPRQGYQLEITAANIRIAGGDGAGVYYAIQTLLQCFIKPHDSIYAPALKISDHPNLAYRAMHYDTKHHQDTAEFVRDFIKDLAH